MELAVLIGGAVVVLVFVLLMRLFGAWMLRINDVIAELNAIKEILSAKLTEEERLQVRRKLQK